jgi:hypothetical protein
MARERIRMDISLKAAAMTAFGGEYLWMKVQLQVPDSSLKRSTNLERKESC